jgi:hypothetical protein
LQFHTGRENDEAVGQLQILPEGQGIELIVVSQEQG